jgi:hypothetical protein
MLETKDPLENRPEAYAILKVAAKYLRVSYRSQNLWTGQPVKNGWRSIFIQTG